MTTNILILAAILMAEAEGESFKGKRIVADTIWNRTSKRTPSALVRIATAKDQYAVPTKTQMKRWQGRGMTAPERKAWRDCQALAGMMVKGMYKPTTTATHFYNPRTAARKRWMSKLKARGQVGNHRYGRLE